MAMTRAQFPSLLLEGLHDVFFEWLDLRSLVYPQVYEIRKSRKKTETDQTIAGIGMADKKTEGLPITYDDFVEGYAVNYTHTTYGKGIRVTREMQDDDLYDVMSKRTKALANAMRYRMEYDHASVFNYATATTVCSVTNGEALLANSHALAGTYGTTVDNLSSSTLSLSALEEAFLYFRKMVNDRNLLVAIEPSVLLIPPDLEFDAYEILKSSGKPFTADNEVNYFQGKLRVITWPFLTNTAAWFVLADKRYGSPVSYNRRPVEFTRDGDFETDDIKMKATMRYSFGATDWRWVYGYDT